MELELAPLLIAALLFGFFLTARYVFTPLIVGILQHVPVVGGFLARKADAIVVSVENTIAKWLKPHLIQLVRWMKEANDALLSLPHSIEYLAGKIEDSIAYLVTTKIPELVHATTATIRRDINALQELASDAAGGIASLGHRIDHLVAKVIPDAADDALARARVGIDRLRRDIFHDTLPAMEARIADAIRGVRGDVATAENEIGRLTRDAIDQAKRLDVPLSLLESLITAVGIVAALEALDTVGKCSPKLRALCRFDPNLWEDLLIGLLTIIAFPGLREMTEMGATVVGELTDALVEIAES